MYFSGIKGLPGYTSHPIFDSAVIAPPQILGGATSIRSSPDDEFKSLGGTSGGRPQAPVVLRSQSGIFRQASLCRITEINPEKLEGLNRAYMELGINENDIDERFIKGSGHGGQKVNKTSNCVQLIHRTTGIVIKCQQHRQRHLNRLEARWLLVEKLRELKNQRELSQRKLDRGLVSHHSDSPRTKKETNNKTSRRSWKQQRRRFMGSFA